MTDIISSPERLKNLYQSLMSRRSFASLDLKRDLNSHEILNGVKLTREEFIDISTLAMTRIEQLLNH